MKGGRLTIRNLGRYPDDEVERLVRYALQEIDVKGSGIVAVVRDTAASKRRKAGAASYSGNAYSYDRGGVPLWLDDVAQGRGLPKRGKRRYPSRWGKLPHSRGVFVVRIGPPEAFPIAPFTRNGTLNDYRTWQEALVGIAAHEAMHCQHYHDGAYEARALVKRGGRQVRRRIGAQRIEPRCEAFERHMLERFRRDPIGGYRNPDGSGNIVS